MEKIKNPKHIHFVMPEELHRKVVQYANETNRSMGAVIRMAIEKFLLELEADK